MSKTTQEDRLKRTHIRLMRHPSFCLLSGVLMMGRTEVVDDVPTACTDGYNTKYGAKFMATLSDAELAFLVLHENFHKAYRHLVIWRKLYDENPRLANAACDYVINQQILDLADGGKDVAMPDKGLYDPKFKGLNAREVFDILKKNPPKDGGGGDFDGHDWEGAQSGTPEEREALAKDVDQALRQGIIHARKFGNASSDALRDVEEALALKVDWRALLREFVSSVTAGRDYSSWRRLNRRFDDPMPMTQAETVGELLVGIDTSSSIGGAELSQFLGELRSICDTTLPERVHLLYWGSKIASHEVHTPDYSNLLATTKPRGGGGTDPASVRAYMQDKRLSPVAAIILTDGHVPNWGAPWPCPVLFCVVGNRTAKADCGQTINTEFN